MTLRTRFLITAICLCHQLLTPALVTSQLLSQNSGQSAANSAPKQNSGLPSSSLCAQQAAREEAGETIICALQQEKVGDVYKLHGNAEIHYRTYIIRADEMTYDSDTGDATGSGHFTLDGGPNDDHIKASHGTYNLTTETGRFYDASGTTGLRLEGNRVILTSTSPFAFTGKMLQKRSPDNYYLYEGTITTCELPHPKWEFDAHKIVVEVGGKAQIYHSSFWLRGIPVFYFPYATYPVDREARETGFLAPTVGKSSSNGYEVGEGFYWAMDRTKDLVVGAEYFSKRGWSQRGEFRARPTDASYIDLTYSGMIDRGITIDNSADQPVLLREGGEEARLLAEGNLYGFRAVSNIDYLSSFIFRLAFNEIFTQAINSEVKSQVFVAKNLGGFSLSGMVERYQDFFQTLTSSNTTPALLTLSNPPVFNNVQIWHDPSVDVSSADRPLGKTPFYWSFDGAVGGLERSEPGFQTGSVLGRFDLSPEVSLPLHFHGWSLRPAVALHDTYYTQRFVGTRAVDDPTNRQALDASVELRPPVLERVFDREFLGKKWKHVIEPRAVYRLVTGVNDFANVLHFDERDILSNTHEVEYGVVTRLYAKRKISPNEPCPTPPMAGLAVGAAAPEQTVPWQHTNILENLPCLPEPEIREVITWELAQKYFLDPTFGGALVSGQRNVFTTSEELTGIAFLTEPRHLSPLVSRLRAATSSHIDTEWDLDYDFQLGRINSSTLLVNYNVGPFTVGGGDAFLQIPQTTTTASTSGQGTCGSTTTVEQAQPTCKFQQFRVGLGYGGLNRRGLSVATSFGFDAELQQLQFATAQTTYNWDCCGLTIEYRRYAIENVRNENLFRFSFTLANIGSLGNLKRQERLY